MTVACRRPERADTLATDPPVGSTRQGRAEAVQLPAGAELPSIPDQQPRIRLQMWAGGRSRDRRNSPVSRWRLFAENQATRTNGLVCFSCPMVVGSPWPG